MEQQTKKKILITSAIVGVVAITVVGVKKCSTHHYKDAPYIAKVSKNPLKMKKPKVEVGKAKIGTVDVFVNCVGNIIPNSQVTIKSEIEGIVKKVNFEDGTDVTKGQLVVSFDDSLAIARHNEILARLAHARAEFDRAKGLQGKKYIAESEVFKREAEMKSLAAQAEVAKIELSKYKIYSPMDGRIGISQVKPGDYVQRGSQIVAIVNENPLEVEFKIPELQLANVRKGQTVIITTENNPTEYYGTITAINPLSEKASHMVIAKAVLDDNDGRIVSGQFANVKIITEHTDQATLIPETSVMRFNGEDFVYRVVDGVALRTNVVIGTYQKRGEVEVLSGIFPGDTVVTKGHIRVQDGAPVKVLNSDPIYKGMDILNKGKVKTEESVTDESAAKAEEQTNTEADPATPKDGTHDAVSDQAAPAEESAKDETPAQTTEGTDDASTTESPSTDDQTAPESTTDETPAQTTEGTDDASATESTTTADQTALESTTDETPAPTTDGTDESLASTPKTLEEPVKN